MNTRAFGTRIHFHYLLVQQKQFPIPTRLPNSNSPLLSYLFKNHDINYKDKENSIIMNKIDDRQQTKTWSAVVVDIFSNAIVSLQG